MQSFCRECLAARRASQRAWPHLVRAVAPPCTHLTPTARLTGGSFWAFMEGFLRSTGLASGSMEPTPEALDHERRHGHHASLGQAAAGFEQQQSTDSSDGHSGAPSTPWGSGWRMRWASQQRGLLRINCADSLDRTNAASCFGMLPALEEALRLVGVALEVGPTPPATAALLRSGHHTRRGSQGSAGSSAHGSGGGRGVPASAPASIHGGGAHDAREGTPAADAGGSAADAAAAAPSPIGKGTAVGLPSEDWESRLYQGRVLYINHATKRTQWEPPSGASGASTPPRPALASPAPAGPEGSPSLPPRPPAGGSGGWMRQSATSLMGHLRRSSPVRTSEAAAGGSSRSSSFGSLGQLGGGGSEGGRSSPDLQPAGAPPPPPPPSPSGGTGTASLERAAALAAERQAQQALQQPWAFFQLGLQGVRDRLLKEVRPPLPLPAPSSSLAQLLLDAGAADLASSIYRLLPSRAPFSAQALLSCALPAACAPYRGPDPCRSATFPPRPAAPARNLGRSRLRGYVQGAWGHTLLPVHRRGPRQASSRPLVCRAVLRGAD